MDATENKSDPVIARYHLRYGHQDRAFRLLDRVLGALVWRRARSFGQHLTSPQRILLVNAGHLGDVIISTGLLPVLHHAFPGVQIGFLTGTYSRAIVDDHPMIARAHFIDHWYLSRRAAPTWRRFLTYLRHLPTLVRELRAADYDIAIDVRSWFPNLVPILWMSCIPVRVAYDRVGGGPLLTHRLRYAYDRRPELESQLDLLRAIGLPQGSLAQAWPSLAPPSEAGVQEARALVGVAPRYRVLHPMSSTSARDWGVENWQSLTQELLACGVTPVVTGSGKRDKAFADAIAAAAPGCLNAVDRLSWSGLVATIQGAEAVYAVETSIGHVASALRRPVISIYGGMADPMHWAPLGAVVATRVLPCHPCINKAGCATRECLAGITVDDVRAAAQAALASV